MAHMTRYTMLSTILGVAFLLTCSGLVTAQIGGGSITGAVTDPSGAAVPGARVVASNLGTNVQTATATNREGYYEFPLLPAGRYSLHVEHEGFRPARSEDFILNSGTKPRIDLKLVVGAVTESVEVVATAPLINATTTDLGVVIGISKVESLPLNGRDFQQLAGLQAGVSAAPGSRVGGRGGMEFHGSPALGNNLLLDGVDMSFGENNAAASDRGAGTGGSGALINTVSVDAIQEFKATGSAFSAEYGRATGGVLNVTTKSGTNDFHGTLFEYFRNDAMDANSFFSNRSGLAKPPLRWNQFGGNLGGPVRRDRTFFFFNYEGAQVRQPQQIVANVATPALLDQTPPRIRENLSLLPKDFTPTTNPLIGLHRRNDANKNDEHTFLGRADENFGHHRLAIRYNYNNQDHSRPNRIEQNRLLFPTRFHNAAVQDSWMIGPSVFNELRGGFNRMDLDRHNELINLAPARITVRGVNLDTDTQSRLHFMTNTYTLADNVSIIRGNHSWKAGFEVRILRSRRDQVTNPTHTYLNLTDLVNDRPTNLTIEFGNPGGGLRNENYGFFVQDDWRVTPRLQLNLGVRYEYYTPMRGAFTVSGSDPLGPWIGKGEAMSAKDRNNFGPRAGLVYDVLGSQKLVVRAGGAISYAPPQPFFLYDSSFVDPRIPFRAELTPGDIPRGFNTAFPIPRDLQDRLIQDPSLLPANLILGRLVSDFNRREEYAGQWNLSLQSALTAGASIQASYAGSRGLKLLSLRDLNLVDPVLGGRPRPDIGNVTFRENAGRSSYHAMQLSFNQRAKGGLTFDAYYTYSKTLQYYGIDGNFGNRELTIQDPLNIAGSRGPKDSDLRHVFTTVYSYPAPAVSKSRLGQLLLGGWTAQGILSASSGRALNVLAGRDLYGNLRVDGQRPDLAAGVPVYAIDTNALTWLNRAAFDIATPAAQRRYGNLGYNALRGPSSFTFDAALHKSFRVREGHRLTFRAEAFNFFNHRNLSNPVNTVSAPNFGTIIAASGGRNVQLALKYVF